jgi:hypothetical protein
VPVASVRASFGNAFLHSRFSLCTCLSVYSCLHGSYRDRRVCRL